MLDTLGCGQSVAKDVLHASLLLSHDRSDLVQLFIIAVTFPYGAGRSPEPDLEISSGTVPGEAQRPQIQLSEPEGRVVDLQCSEPLNGRRKVLKGERALAAHSEIR